MVTDIDRAGAVPSVTLPTAFADAAVADLSWSMDLLASESAVDTAGLPPLASLDVGSGDGPRLSLHLLGASHRAVLSGPGTGPVLVETVACVPTRRVAPVPETVERRSGRFRYAFRSRIRRPAPEAFEGDVRELLATLPAGALVGRFPGVPHAVTVLDGWARPGAGSGPSVVGWRTWHVYPQAFEIVETESEVVVGAARIEQIGPTEVPEGHPGSGAGARPDPGGSGLLVV